jgi:hypothetical protein
MKLKKGTLKQFVKGKVCVDFIGCYGGDCKLLRELLSTACPEDKKDMPAYVFGNYYYVEGTHWYESSWKRMTSLPIKSFYKVAPLTK